MTDEQEYSHIYKALEDAEKRVDEGFPATDILIVMIHKGKSGTLMDVVSSKKEHETRYLMLARQLHNLTIHPLAQEFIHQDFLRSN
jgi:hypothetical protein